jgi:F0F1-type ATP synthase assembly protein I
MKSPLRKKHRQTQEQFNAYAKYSALAIQMMLIISVGTYGGFCLDKYFGWNFPAFMLVFSLLSVGMAIWYAVKDLMKK